MALTSSDMYTILGLEPGCTIKDVQQRRRVLQRKYHPDQNPNDPEAEEQAKKVNNAASELERILTQSTTVPPAPEHSTPRPSMGSIAQRLAAKVKAEKSPSTDHSSFKKYSPPPVNVTRDIPHPSPASSEKSMFQQRLNAPPSIRENAGTNAGGRIILGNINESYREVYFSLEDNFAKAANQYLFNMQGTSASTVYGELHHLDSDLLICSSILDEVYLKKFSNSSLERRQKIVLPLVTPKTDQLKQLSLEDLIIAFGTTIALIPHPNRNPISSQYEQSFWTIYNHITTNMRSAEIENTPYLHQLTNLAGTIVRLSTDPKIRKELTSFLPDQHSLLSQTLNAILPVSTNIYTCITLFSSLSKVATNHTYLHWSEKNVKVTKTAVAFIKSQELTLNQHTPDNVPTQSISPDQKWQVICEATEFVNDYDLGLSKNYYSTWEATITKLSSLYFSPDLEILVPLILTLSDASHRYEQVRYPANLEEAITALTILLPVYQHKTGIIEEASKGLYELKRDARGKKSPHYTVTARVARAVEYISYCIEQCNQYPHLENNLPQLTEILGGFAKSRYYHEPHQSQKVREKIAPPTDHTTQLIYGRLEQVQTKPHDKRTLSTDDIHYIIDTFVAKFK